MDAVRRRMKPTINHIRCWWFGCEGHPQDTALPDYGLTCMHCGDMVTYGDAVGDTRHNRFMESLNAYLRRVWPKKCFACGGRWRHDETKDHIPF